jgi:hypothetical protein
MMHGTYLAPEFKMLSYGFSSNENLFNFWPDFTILNQVLHVAHDVHPFPSTWEGNAHSVLNFQKSNIGIFIAAH